MSQNNKAIIIDLVLYLINFDIIKNNLTVLLFLCGPVSTKNTSCLENSTAHVKNYTKCVTMGVS